MIQRPPGIAETELPADDLLGTLALNYELRQPLAAAFLTRGINDTYVVQSGGQRFILRVYRRGLRTEKEIEAELSIIGLLHEGGVGVSRPVRARDESLIQEVNSLEGTRYAVLFDFASGERPVEYDPNLAHTVGRTLATIHNSLDLVKEPYMRQRMTVSTLIDEPLKLITGSVFWRPSDHGFLLPLASELRNRVLQFPSNPPFYGICHGDFHRRNFHVAENGRITLFDFDVCGYVWRPYEFASLLRDIGSNTAVWNALIAGYREQRRMEETELRSIYVFWAVRSLWELGLQAMLAEEIGKERVEEVFEFETSRLLRWIKEYELG